MWKARSSRNAVAVAAVVALAFHAMALTTRAQTPSYPGIGRTPTAEELQRWDFAISPSGKELPAGSGTAKTGAAVYMAKCSMCHAPDLTGTIYGVRLVGSRATLTTPTPMRTVGSFWPYATTLWDYINRAMPRAPFKEGSLTPAEVYGVTAFILYKNGIIKEDEAMNATTLPKVQMPNHDGFLPPRPDYQWYRSACRLGWCAPAR